MNGRDFLVTARRMAGTSDEADWRSAASRAYYAAFHVARDLLSGLRFRTPRADRAHEYLYRRLNNCGEPVAVRAASLLHALRTLRNLADYDVGVPFPVQDAHRSISDSGGVVQILDGLTPAERTRITDAVKLYEQQIGDVTWHP